jgi:glucosyl-3-phosphoglycerate phosphatase
MSPRRVVLWRHGRTAWNLEMRFQGSTDVPLDDVGRAQADRAARDLATLRPDRIVSSDLDRARSTAAALADLVDLPVETDPALQETYAGRWQGLVRHEIIALDPELYARWSDGADVRPGGGESRSEVAARVSTAVRRYAALGGLVNCAWSVLEELPDGRWRLVEHNARSLPEDVIGDEA